MVEAAADAANIYVCDFVLCSTFCCSIVSKYYSRAAKTSRTTLTTSKFQMGRLFGSNGMSAAGAALRAAAFSGFSPTFRNIPKKVTFVAGRRHVRLLRFRSFRTEPM